MMHYHHIAFAASLISMPAIAVSPSFDCSNAAGEVETLICQDSSLSTLDKQMAEVYPAALANYPEQEQATAKAMQRGWIKGRNECWKASDIKSCVEFAYKSRIVELQITGGLLTVPEAKSYQCRETDKPFTAVFYPQTDPASAVFTWGDQQVIALIARSASGSKYAGRNVTFWEHQGEVQVEWLDSQLSCKPISE